MKELQRLLMPKTIAVIGASATEGSVGYSVLKNIAQSMFAGKVYPVNPKRNEILGIKCFPSISKTPEKIDLAIIATPASTVPAIVEECGKAGVGGVVIITAGFKEAGEEGQKYWAQLQKSFNKTRLPIIGPNCLGFMRPSAHLNATFATTMPKQGRIAFVSQSGALGTAMLDWSLKANVGFSYFISIGNMIDVGFYELIEFLGNDDETESIVMYMESLANPKEFIEAAKEITPKKPIIVIKVGKSEAGAHAAMSHTGSLAGNDAIFDLAFRKAGIIRINTTNELFDLSKFLARKNAAVGKNIAIITNAGGPGVIATDYIAQKKGRLASLSKETIAQFNKMLPSFWSHGNPIDILGDATPDRYKQALETVAKDRSVDTILVILTPQAMTNPEEAARQIVAADAGGKTLACAFIGGVESVKGKLILGDAGIPCYDAPEEGLNCVITLSNRPQPEKTVKISKQAVKKGARKIILNVARGGRTALTEKEAKTVLEEYGISSAKSGIAKNKTEAGAIAAKLCPAVMKILSPDILHKTDVGGVKLNIQDKVEAEKTYEEIIRSVKKKVPKAKIEGVLIEQQVVKDYELLLGSKKDPLFGHVIMFGMGGTAVELYKDTAMDMVPITEQSAGGLISSTKIGALMSGYRGSKKVDIKPVKQAILRLSQLLQDFPEIKEIDINPLAVCQKGAKTEIYVLDAKIVLE